MTTGSFILSVTPEDGETVSIVVLPDEALRLRFDLDRAIEDWLADIACRAPSSGARCDDHQLRT